jgi:oligopeptide/dipeptide ABC transporter ATP-binding protein
LTILGLLPPPGRVTAGRISFEQQNLLELPAEDLRRLRGERISMIFQEPMNALNPVLTIGDQLGEVYRLHHGTSSRRAALAQAAAMLGQVGIEAPERRLKSYPHQLSGGMCQRVMIAMALACRPGLLLADEPTTALDVTTQAQILGLMNDLKQATGTAIILVSHDLAVVAEVCEQVAVMYAGQIVEQTSCSRLFSEARHPYARGLINSRPRLGSSWHEQRLQPIGGTVPPLGAELVGCSFLRRCGMALPRCAAEAPPAFYPNPDHLVRCWRCDG